MGEFFDDEPLFEEKKPKGPELLKDFKQIKWEVDKVNERFDKAISMEVNKLLDDVSHLIGDQRTRFGVIGDLRSELTAPIYKQMEITRLCDYRFKETIDTFKMFQEYTVFLEQNIIYRYRFLVQSLMQFVDDKVPKERIEQIGRPLSVKDIPKERWEELKKIYEECPNVLAYGRLTGNGSNLNDIEKNFLILLNRERAKFTGQNANMGGGRPSTHNPTNPIQNPAQSQAEPNFFGNPDGGNQ